MPSGDGQAQALIGSTPAPRGGTAVAYFSMEVAVGDAIPTYSGGLGVLAGDFLRAAADLGLSAVGVTLVYHEGFFRQRLDADGAQVEKPVTWDPSGVLEALDEEVVIEVGGRPVTVGAWRLELIGGAGAWAGSGVPGRAARKSQHGAPTAPASGPDATGPRVVPVIFLDTRRPANDEAARAITDRLYTGDPAERLAQETVLGLGGVAMLERLGFGPVSKYHLNEGHAALVPLALLEAGEGGVRSGTDDALQALRARCVFTTHTPVPAGHDRFPITVVDDVLGAGRRHHLEALGAFEGDTLNMSVLGMACSGWVNGVSRRHGDVSQDMFRQFAVQAVTNGVHVGTWVAPPTRRMLDRHVPGWAQDASLLREATAIPLDEVRAAHREAKVALCREVERRCGARLDPRALTLVVARRSTPYKRNDLLLSDHEALRRIVDEVGPLQIVYSGKSHPMDGPGKAMIRRVAESARSLAPLVPVVYLPDYSMALAAALVAGADVWVNTPLAPHEASGTSGMKAALNAVPSLSVLDGWWLEGHIEGVTGWAIGSDQGAGVGHEVGDQVADAADAAELFRVLGETVAPLYYGDPEGYAEVGRFALALNGSFFTTQRMLDEYATRAYGLRVPPLGRG